MQKINLTSNKDRKSTPAVSASKKNKKNDWSVPWWGWVIVGVIGLIIFVVTIVFVIALSAKSSVEKFRDQAMDTYSRSQWAYEAFKDQDYAEARKRLASTKESFGYTRRRFEDLKASLNLAGYGKYYSDGLIVMDAIDETLDLAEEVVDIVEPAAEVLGLTGKDEENEGTTEDRVKMVLEALQVIGPQMDAVIAGLERVQAHVSEIDAKKYPTRLGDLLGMSFVLKKAGHEELIDLNAQEKITDLQEKIAFGIQTLKEYRPILDKIPEMAGGTGQRKKYLVIFQNNNELRPTGGFLTAYAVIFVEDGKVVPEKSDDIYELDKKFNKKIAIPEKLGKYLTTEKYWNLRDMNIDPDFSRSMETFLENYDLVPGEPHDIDGIVTIDTFVLTSLIDILGPVQVEGYGEFSTEKDAKYDAPQIIVALSEIITRPTPYIREDRKGILGPMMKAMLEKVYGAGSAQFPALFSALMNLIEGRHVQVYFMDKDLQESAEMINVAGRMNAPEDGSDFLAIVDANLGGAKSNLFIDYEVEQTVLPPENGKIEKRVVITYTNSQAGDNCNLEAGLLCLNAVNRDWFRMYVPEGAELIEAKGFKGDTETYDENGFTVFDGYFFLNPKSSTKLDITYTVPYAKADEYDLQIWQQGGLREVPHVIDVNGEQESIVVSGDTKYSTKF